MGPGSGANLSISQVNRSTYLNPTLRQCQYLVVGDGGLPPLGEPLDGLQVTAQVRLAPDEQDAHLEPIQLPHQPNPLEKGPQDLTS